MTDIHYWTAFGAGLLSFFSPCVLPLVPAYIANLAGASAIASNENRRMWPTLLHSISFILGFSILFILMGACAGLIGSAMTTYAEPIRIVSGIVVIIFGIFLVATYKIPWLNYEKRLHLKQHSSNPGYIRSALIGAAFAAPIIFTVKFTILGQAGCSKRRNTILSRKANANTDEVGRLNNFSSQPASQPPDKQNADKGVTQCY